METINSPEEFRVYLLRSQDFEKTEPKYRIVLLEKYVSVVPTTFPKKSLSAANDEFH